ncbi:hypothetical protein [Variovorax sp. YR752]|uniref:hypothetical protein n=1 Tax=Variovorax sp. YR752 TaxID=1884383 RepID=UPI0031377527
MPDALARLWNALRPGGTLYVSFKHGTGERLHGERRFTDADEASLRQWFGRLSDVRQLPKGAPMRARESVQGPTRGTLSSRP